MKFRVDTKEEQVWGECSRLIANAIIFYNSYLLSTLLVQMEEKKRTDLVEQIKRMSPIAWQHVNLGWRFELTKQKTPPNIEEMLLRLESFLENSTC